MVAVTVVAAPGGVKTLYYACDLVLFRDCDEDGIRRCDACDSRRRERGAEVDLEPVMRCGQCGMCTVLFHDPDTDGDRAYWTLVNEENLSDLVPARAVTGDMHVYMSDNAVWALERSIGQ